MSKLIIANWKMNPSSVKEVGILLKGIIKNKTNNKNKKIIICSPFIYLPLLKSYKIKGLELGSQDVSLYDKGSHTGEISSSMLFNLGIRYSIVGHSERRNQGENNEIINQKILNLLKAKINPILCIGEEKRDQGGQYLNVIEEQIKSCLKDVSNSQIKDIIIVYEPIWAIGVEREREATKEEFTEIKIFIKKVISDIYGLKIAHSIRVLYGGSVNSLNGKYYVDEAGADGLLIGRDSLDPKKFSAIINSIE
jgi:triosephosphate isomerase